MSYLIPQITLSQLQSMTPGQVKDSPSVIITNEEGHYLGILIVPQTDFIKAQAEYMGEMSNGVKPRKDDVPVAMASNETKVKRVRHKIVRRKKKDKPSKSKGTMEAIG